MPQAPIFMLQTLRETLFDTPPEPAFDRLTALISKLLDAPVSLLTLVDERRAFYKSAQGLPAELDATREVGLSHSLCSKVVEGDAELVIEDARAHPDFAAHKAVTELGVGCYLGVPVHGPDGVAFGSICAIGLEKREWSARDREIVATLAKSIEAEIALREALARQECVLGELRAAHAAIDAARDVERELDERTRFFTSLSHEIRTPLNGVLGGLALLEIASDPAAREEYAAMIRSSADALLRFIDDLVGFARDSSGRGTARVAPFDPRGPLEGARRTLAPAAAEKGLELRLEVEDDVPGRWSSDACRIERLLLTLGANAVQYTGAGEIEMSLGCGRDRLAYRVRDTGPGIGAAFHDRIFEPFDRGDPALSQRINGTGLGLAVARRSARLFGASLKLEASSPGRGSTFLLEVPRG